MQFNVQVGDQDTAIEATPLDADGRTTVTMGPDTYQVELRSPGPHVLRVADRQGARNLYAVRTAEGVWVWADGRARLVRPLARRRRGDSGRAAAQVVTPPMPAVVVKVVVAVDDVVSRGQPLVVVSAMKMEMTLSAPHDGTVRAIHTQVGAKVSPGQVLVDVEPTPTADEPSPEP